MIRTMELEWEDRGVSPVIGVILMVAITVILAAVIAAFVLGIGPGSDTVSGSVSVSGDGTSAVTLSVSDGSGADQVVVADGGDIVWVNEANTGASYEISDGEQEINIGAGNEEELTVWLIVGELDTDNTLDNAEGTLELDSFTLQGQ